MNKRSKWRDSMSTAPTLMTPLIDPSTSLITSTWRSADLCSSMPSSRLRMRSIPLFHSEEAAEKVSVVHAPWILMGVIIWLAFAQLTKRIWKNQQSHHSCSCLCWRIWLLTCLTSTLSINQLIPIWSARQAKSPAKENSSSQLRIESFSMDSMSACSALAASQPAPLTGGTLRTTWDLLFSCKPTGGLLTLVMNSLMKDSRNSEVIWSSVSATKLVFALSLALRVLTLEEPLSTSNLYTKNIKCARNLNYLPFEHLSQLNDEPYRFNVWSWDIAVYSSITITENTTTRHSTCKLFKA